MVLMGLILGMTMSAFQAGLVKNMLAFALLNAKDCWFFGRPPRLGP